MLSLATQTTVDAGKWKQFVPRFASAPYAPMIRSISQMTSLRRFTSLVTGKKTSL